MDTAASPAHPNERLLRVFHVREGKLAELWIHPLDQHAIDEFWA